MRVAFRATQAGFEADEYALICGVAGVDAAGRDHALTFQRAPEDDDPAEDGGIYAEFDGQGQSGYNLIAACHLTRERLMVDLSAPLGRLDAVNGFDVELAVGDA